MPTLSPKHRPKFIQVPAFRTNNHPALLNHTTIYCWAQHFAPTLALMRAGKCRAKLKSTNTSSRVDETYVKVKGQWIYLYRAVDSDRNIVEFMLQRLRKPYPTRYLRKAFLPQGSERQVYSHSTRDQRG
jgi:transposase-like protein